MPQNLPVATNAQLQHNVQQLYTGGKYVPRAVLVDLEPGTMDHLAQLMSTLPAADVHYPWIISKLL